MRLASIRGTTIGTLLLLLPLGAATAPALAQDQPEAAACAADAAELRAAVEDVHRRQRNVGVAAAVLVDGALAFETYLGAADLEHDVPVGPETRFGIASVTKLFTAVGLLRLEAAGTIEADAPVQRYVPAFPEKRGGPITIEMLATHRSGIPHPDDRTPELFATRYETATDALEVYRDAELVHEPGTERTYSSSNYNLIAVAIEGATGRTFQAFLAGEILRPLGLDDTAFDDVLAVVPGRARRYSFYHPWTYAERDTLYRVPTRDYSFNPGGGNLTSTVRDLVVFGGALLEPGPILDAASWERLFDQRWFGRRSDAGESFVFANGANPGVQAGLAVYPERGVAAAVLSNTWGLGSRSGEMAGLARVLAEACRPAS